MKKFDIEEYTARKIREYRGETIPVRSIDKEIGEYTSKRIRELRGEPVYWDTLDDRTEVYCRLRIRELKLERFLRDRNLLLDNRKLGSYTISTMEDNDGES